MVRTRNVLVMASSLALWLAGWEEVTGRRGKRVSVGEEEST